MSPKHILIVDDDLLMQRTWSRALEAKGYLVQVVANGEHAMALVQQDPPDLLMTDCFLPKMDGIHLCKFLRADRRFRRLPMILISGQLDPEILSLCREFGIDASFEKGAQIDQVLAEIERLLHPPSTPSLSPRSVRSE